MEQMVSKYLKYLNIPISKSYLEKLIASHPDYPSLLSISDKLERLGIEHKIARIGQEYLEDLPFPYVLHFDIHGGELVLIKDERDLKAREADFEHWDGVILRAEPTDSLIDEEHSKQLSEEKFLKVAVGVGLVAAAVLLFLPAIQVGSWLYTGLLVTALTGAITGYLLLAKEVGINYEAVEAFCNTGTRANCDRILKSEDARLWDRITFSDAAMSYFAFQLVGFGSLVPLVDDATTFLAALATMSLFTIPVVVYSLYYQGLKSKTWCRLCLIVDAVLLLQVVLFGYMYGQAMIEPAAVNMFSLVLFGALFLVTGASVLGLKTMLEQASRSRQAEVEANRIKYAPEVFLHLLHQSQRADTSPFEHEILLGSPDAPVKVIMAANLFCHPCKVGFGKADRLIAAYPQKVSLAIRLLRSGPGNGRHPVASRYLLAYWFYHIHGTSNELSRTRTLFMDWYESMNISDFMSTNPMEEFNLDDPSIEDLEASHIEWIEQESIRKTPSWFVNGYELPQAYRIEDLMGMAAGLAESVQHVSVLESKGVL